MSKSTISTFELFQMFPDAEAARVYMEGKRWPDGAVCPACDEAKRITTRKGGFYRCNACKTDFTVRTATIFERSKAPLHKWLAALAIVAERPDIASYDLGEVLGLTQKTGWLSSYLTRPARELEHVRALREVVIPDASPYAFPQAARAPRGTHVCGHAASLVWFLTWASRQPRAWCRDDLGWNEDATRALDDAIRNGYVARAGGGAIPAAYGHSSVRFVVSEAGRAVLARAAAAAEGRAAA